MLNALENLLLSAVSSVLPNSTKAVAGIISTPLVKDLPLVNVVATSLHTTGDSKNDDNKRTPAFFTQKIKFTGNGKKLDFLFPKDTSGAVLEVELTTGRLAKTGDDYWQEAQTLHFYTAPKSEFSALIQGKPAQGYQQLSPCSISLGLEVWSNTLTEADNLLVTVLATSLAALTDLDRIELARIESSGFSLRLIKPLAEISNLERKPKADGALFCSTAQLLIRGELELTLALGTPAPQGMIQTIEGHVSNANNQTSISNFTIDNKNK